MPRTFQHPSSVSFQVRSKGWTIQAKGSQQHVETSFRNGGKEASFRLNLEVGLIGGAR